MPHQIPVLQSRARFKAVACGRRWGKTALGLMAVLDGHGAGIGALDGGNVWWVTSDYKLAKKVIWPNLKKATAGAWTWKSEVDHVIQLPGGGSVTVRSADNPDSLRGDGLDGLVLDEAAFQAEYLWTDVLRPALTDRRGWAVFISTPNGKNWFHDLFKRGGASPGWESWQRPSSDNPLLAPEELEAARHDLGPRSFRQEYGAEFMDVGGAEWPGEWFGEGLWFKDWPQDSIVLRVVALDPSKGKRKEEGAGGGDDSAFALLARDRSGTLWVEGDLDNLRPTTRIVTDGIALAARFERETGGRLDGFGCETDQFQELLADLFVRESRAAGIMVPMYKMTTGGTPKEVRIRRLTPYLSQKQLRFRDTPGTRRLVRQLQEFPVGEHDDGPDALEYALRLAVHLWNGKRKR